MYEKPTYHQLEQRVRELDKAESERKQGTDALFSNANYTLLRMAGKTARFGGWSADLRTNIVTWSDVVADIHGMPKGYSPLVEEGIRFYAPEWREKITQVFTDCAENGVSYDEEMEIITQKGERVWVRTAGVGIKDEHGKIVKVQGSFQDITNFKQIKEALRETSENLQAILNHSPLLISEFDVEGRYLLVNIATASMFNLAPSEMVGKTFGDLLPPDIFRLFMERISQVTAIRRPIIVDDHVRLQESEHYFITTLFPLFDPSGKLRSIGAIAHDITEHKKTQDLLRVSEERYRSFVQHTSEGVYMLALDKPIDVALPSEEQVDALYERAHIAECNDAFARMYGLTIGTELIGQHLIQFHGGRDHPINRAEVRKFVESGYHITDEETREIGQDGAVRWFSNTTMGIVEDGFLLRMWGTQTDITDRIRATQTIAESELRYRSIVSALPDLLFRIDSEMRFTDVQTRMPEMLLAPADQIVGKTVWDILPPDIVELTREKFQAVIETGDMQIYNYGLDMRGERKECETRMVPFRDGEVLAIVRDITERDKLQKNLMETVDREQKKLAQELHDGLCQDLKGLEIEAALLEDMVAGRDAAAAELAASVGKQVNLAVRKAYAVARGMLPVELDAESFSTALSELGVQMERKTIARMAISIQKDLIPPDSLHVRHLYRIAQEALSNALRHANASEIELCWRREGGNSILLIRDNGTGLNNEQTDQPKGLGLAVMRTRAQSIGASFHIRSRVGNGTEVRVMLNAKNGIQNGEQ